MINKYNCFLNLKKKLIHQNKKKSLWDPQELENPLCKKKQKKFIFGFFASLFFFIFFVGLLFFFWCFAIKYSLLISFLFFLKNKKRLDVLANKKNVGTITGDLIFNGKSRNRFFSRISGYVEQFDSHHTLLTVREGFFQKLFFSKKIKKTCRKHQKNWERGLSPPLHIVQKKKIFEKMKKKKELCEKKIFFLNF